MSIAHQIMQSIRPRDDWWLPGLAAQLADRHWREIASPAFPRADYDTERYLRMRGELPSLGEATTSSPRSGLVAYVGASLAHHYEPIGLDAATIDDLPMEVATSCLGETFALIGQVPSLLATVRELVLAVHPLRAPSPDTDVSYSDPNLPFSIFVGIADKTDPVGRLRLAEGIVHEAMHLQLSLIERLVPMVARDQDLWHSPWRDEERPIGGILHGAYVFAVVRDFLRRLLDLDVLDVTSRVHAVRRRSQVEEELGEVSWLPDCEELTPAGRSLAYALIPNVHTGASRQPPPSCSVSSSGTGLPAR